jgi:hypothetical protein
MAEELRHTLQTTALINEVYLRLARCGISYFRVNQLGPKAKS